MTVDPICHARITQYPELEYVRDTPPHQRKKLDKEDLEDAGHQWAIRYDGSLIQKCFDCPVTRTKPFEYFDEWTQIWLLQQTLRRKEGEA